MDTMNSPKTGTRNGVFVSKIKARKSVGRIEKGRTYEVELRQFALCSVLVVDGVVITARTGHEVFGLDCTASIRVAKKSCNLKEYSPRFSGKRYSE